MTAGPDLILQRSSGWRALNLREVWAYRELLYFFVWRDIKVRYKQTFLGITWVLIRPILSVAIFSIIFGKLARIPSEELPYPLFVLAGTIPWTYFSGALSAGSSSLVANAHMITKVYFPRLVIPLASITACLVDVAISFVLILGLMGWYGRTPPLSAIWTVPLLFLLTAAVSLGASLWLGALNVTYRDVGNAVPFLLQIWMYATPIVYPLSLIPAEWRWVASINPLVGIVDGFRSALFSRPWNFESLSLSVAFGIVLLLSGLFFFRASERDFADSV
jgi:lipopolysaccharide transport system permease protein